MKIHRKINQPEQPSLEVEPSEGIEEVALARGLTVDTLTRYGVHVDDHGTHPIVFPYPSLSGVWYERRRAWLGDDQAGKYLSPKGSSPHLYNPLHLGPNAGQVWFCEGEFDTLALIEFGLPALGVAGTNAFNRKWLHLYEDSEVVIAFDGDPSGRKAGEKLLDAFRARRTRAFSLPTPDGKDMNELYQEGELGTVVDAFADDRGLEVEYLEGSER